MTNHRVGANIRGIDLAELKADMEAQHRGYSSAEAERRIMENANSGKIARKAARKAARARRTGQSEPTTVGNWTVAQFERTGAHLRSENLEIA